VQHLGHEFQEMAAERAAELNEAYRTLSDKGRRAEYDLGHGAAPAGRTAAAPAAAAAGGAATETPAAEAETGAPPRNDSGPNQRQFQQERLRRDRFVLKAAVGRFAQALAVIDRGYEGTQVPGFDIAYVPKSRIFARHKGPQLLGRFVDSVDAAAIADTWEQVGKLTAPADAEICVFLMGSEVAPARELADAIAHQRRRGAKGRTVVLIPVDARNWDAHVPTDAPAIARTLLAGLRKG
jgi:curved DNA-binding protein CbpA